MQGSSMEEMEKRISYIVTQEAQFKAPKERIRGSSRVNSCHNRR